MNRKPSTQLLRSSRRGRQGLGRQAGLTILSALLALAIGATVTYGQIQGQVTKLLVTDGQLEGDLFNRIKDAQNTYALENYPSLQNDLPVTKNGVTLPVGGVVGQTLSPRVEDLVAMGYLVNGTTSASNKIEGGTYRVQFRKSPAGCAPTVCDIVGDSFIDKPYFRTGTTEVQGPSVGAFIERVGGDAAISLTGTPAVFISANQVTTANPVSGNPAGVIGARVGFGSSGFGRFLIVGDSRDPNFQGGTTINGSLRALPGTAFNVRGNSRFDGNVALVDPATGVSCIDMLNVVGQISIKCQGLLNARIGTFTSAVDPVQIGSNNASDLASVTTSGRIQAIKGFLSGASSLFSDDYAGPGSGNPNGIKTNTRFSVVNGAGNETFETSQNGVTSSSSAFLSNRLGLALPVILGSACGTPQALAPGGAGATTTSATTALAAIAGGGLASCVNGTWSPVSLPASPGSACAADGTAATSVVDGRALTCKNGVYLQMSDMLSAFVLMETIRVTDGSIVQKPTCGQNGAGVGTPTPIILAQLEASITDAGTASFFRSVEDASSTQWRAVLKDSQGNSLTSAEALFQSFCYY